MAAQISTLPPPPNKLANPDDFVAESDVWVAALPPWTTEVNALAIAVEADANQASAAAEQAAADAVSAATSSSLAASAASFKGDWSALTGAVVLPYGVSNNGTFWSALVPIADITTSEPGVSADWIENSVVSAATEAAGAIYSFNNFG